jgi:succinate dehydrogenase/fumarate reductase cytochrome b subunit
MPYTDLAVAGTFATSQEAELAVSALQAAGIDAIIQSESTGGVTPHLAFSGGGFRVLVRDFEAEEAREVLEL